MRSVDRVYDELIERDDDLSDWARARRPFFVSLTAADVRSVAEVNRWANDSPDYDPAAKAEFADAADSFLVAQAKAGGHTVVTHERISDGRKRIKIPNAAAAHGVQWCAPFQIFRKAQNRIQDPAKLRRLVVNLINEETWTSVDADLKGDAYEGLLQKGAEDTKSAPPACVP